MGRERGAAVGDVLEIRICDIELRQNWGYNLFRAYGGTLPDEFPYYRLIHLELDRERLRERDHTLELLARAIRFALGLLVEEQIDAEQYDDAEIKKYIVSLQTQEATMRADINGINSTLVSNANTMAKISESVARAQEKASDAIGTP